MTPLSTRSGIWLPLITPFRDGAVDFPSLRRLVRHYAGLPVDGLILGATTGEALALDDDELHRLTVEAAEALAGYGHAPTLFIGLSGSDTRKMVKAVRRVAALPVAGCLIACPYYVRPSQEGLYHHFLTIAEAADQPLWIYNIPYRTGVNMSNNTLLRLAEHPRITGLKDCCAEAGQSFDLLCRRPPGFQVFTGEDASYFAALAQGADGGILASAHVETAAFARVGDLLRQDRLAEALVQWRAIATLTGLLFAEPNPAPVKHWLWREGLIDSPELRLPMTGVSAALAQRLDAEIERRRAFR